MNQRNRKHPATASERVRQCRARVENAGGRRLEVMLNPEAAQALELLLSGHNGTLRECIEDLLIRAAAGRRR